MDKTLESITVEIHKIRDDLQIIDGVDHLLHNMRDRMVERADKYTLLKWEVKKLKEKSDEIDIHE